MLTRSSLPPPRDGRQRLRRRLIPARRRSIPVGDPAEGGESNMTFSTREDGVDAPATDHNRTPSRTTASTTRSSLRPLPPLRAGAQRLPAHRRVNIPAQSHRRMIPDRAASTAGGSFASPAVEAVSDPAEDGESFSTSITTPSTTHSRRSGPSFTVLSERKTPTHPGIPIYGA